MSLDKEKFAFNLFLDLYGKLPPGEKSERPDYIIFKDSIKIGIELTELINPETGESLLAAQYSLEDKIAKFSQIEFDQFTEKRIMVTIQFREKLHIKSIRLKQLSHEITSILINTTNKLPNTLIHDMEIIENLPSEVLGLYYDITPFLEESHFSVMRGKWPTPFNLNDISRVIEKKNDNILIYRTNADLIYLLVTEGFVPKSWYGDFTNSGTLIKNSFDKIFLLRIMSRQLFEIK